MRRDPARLATDFDVLVVGGGIYGLMASWEASLRGLRVALIERGDFGAATSFNSARTIHGGVRSLQRAALGEMYDYLDERRILAIIAPHLVHPLPFAMPATRSVTANLAVLRAYFGVYDWLASRHPSPPDPSKRLPPSRAISRDEFLALNPYAEPSAVCGGMVWYDCQLHSSERMAIALARSAAQEGAVLCNYVEAVRLEHRHGSVAGVRARDVVTRDEFEIRARATVNATGPGSRALLSGIPQSPTAADVVPALSKAMNLVIGSKTCAHALAGSARGRLFFLAPWRGVTIAGTSHDRLVGQWPTDLAAEGDIAPLMADLNLAFPRLALREDDVRYVHRGALPATATRGSDVVLMRSSVVHDHAREALDGLFSIVGVRYTTARSTARQAIDLLCAKLGKGHARSRSDRTPLVGGAIEDYATFERAATSALAQHVPPPTALRLARHYGSELTAIRERLVRDPASRRPLSASCDISMAELSFVIEHEMVVTLADLVVRRLDALQTGALDATAVHAAAEVLGGIRQWSPARTQSEIDALHGLGR